MTLIVGTNTYLTLEEANTYFESRLYNTAWLNASAEDKEKALIMACRKIKSIPLSIPEVIPENFKNAQCEESVAILEYGNSKRIKLQQQGVKSMSLGDMSESYAGKRILLSADAEILLKPYKMGSVPIC